MFFEKQVKGFELVRLGCCKGPTHHGRRIETNHVDLSEDSERDLFDGRGLSPSEDVALEEEERVVMGGGRLPRFLNLSSKLRFLSAEGRQTEVSVRVSIPSPIVVEGSRIRAHAPL